MTTDEQHEQRRKRAADLRAMGKNPYPAVFRRSHSNREIEERFVELEGKTVAAAGRIRTLRRMGKAAFFDLHDATGKVQAYVKRDIVGDEGFELFKLLDLGDHVGVTGETFKTRTGEVTVKAERIEILNKSLRPMPEKFHGLQDVETRYRRRYLDLIANDDVKSVFRARSRIVRRIREYLHDRGFLEVETPMMQSVPGGALARPFVTHHNALDADLFLRVAPELHLKRLMVGGFERVFEINRNFRNEGVSTRHNPEFTMLELYQAYADYQDMMDLAQDLISTLVREIEPSGVLTYGSFKLDFNDWRRMKWIDAVRELSGTDVTLDLSREELASRMKARGVGFDPKISKGKLFEKLFDEFVEPTLEQPTFIYDFPTEISPLARKRDDDPLVTERFELFVANFEVVNAFSELIDPEDQLSRFEAQQKEREGGDDEAHAIDRDYVFALEHGMPPTGGLGLGVDRLTMLLTDSPSIRDVILFPLMKRME